MDFYQSLVNPQEEICCKTWNLRYSLLPGHLRCFANLFGRSKPLKPLSVAKSLTTYLELSSMFLSGDRRWFSDYKLILKVWPQTIVCAVFGDTFLADEKPFFYILKKSECIVISTRGYILLVTFPQFYILSQWLSKVVAPVIKFLLLYLYNILFKCLWSEIMHEIFASGVKQTINQSI